MLFTANIQYYLLLSKYSYILFNVISSDRPVPIEKYTFFVVVENVFFPISVRRHLPEQAACQSQALEEIRQQMAQSLQSDSQLNKQVGQVCDTLAKLDQDTISQTEWMEQVCRTFTLTDRHLKLTLARQHRRFLWLSLIHI